MYVQLHQSVAIVQLLSPAINQGISLEEDGGTTVIPPEILTK